MAEEIERKFLVKNDSWRQLAESSKVMKQGYLSENPAKAVRIRVAGDHAWLTIKGLSDTISSPEFEYEIPVPDAEFMLSHMCDQGLVEKERFYIRHQGHLWEVDEFYGVNRGLILAEIELTDKDELFAKPDWLDKEVSEDPRYFNVRLMQHPYTSW